MTDHGSEGFFINDRDQLIGHCFMEAVEWCREHPLYEGPVYFRERETDEWEDYPWPLRQARSEDELTDTQDEAFDAWIDILNVDVVQQEYGYEEGEFTVYPTLWRGLYDRGLTPSEAFRVALDEHKKARER